MLIKKYIINTYMIDCKLYQGLNYMITYSKNFTDNDTPMK